MKIAYIYNERHIDTDGINRNTSPTDYAYGAFELIKMGHHVNFINMELWNPSYTPKKIVLLLTRFLAPYFLNNKSPDQYIIEALRLSRIIADRYDIIVSIPRKMTLALACCKRWGNLYPEVVGIQTGILNTPDQWYQKKIISDTFKFIHSITLGAGELSEMKKRYNLTSKDISLIPFGVDIDFWKPAASYDNREPMVLSVGNDYFRDFELLLKVARKISVKFVIVTRNKLKGEIPSNVQIIKGSTGKPALTFSELRDLYRAATCLVTPIKETFQPSGQSSTLQAMACGVPTVIADFKGIWSYSQMQDDKTTLFYKPGNITNCYDAIHTLLSNKTLRENIARNARQMVEYQANSMFFAQNLFNLCENIVTKRRS
jgi:glycosyltransferase involved in cell wall biosynthesis